MVVAPHTGAWIETNNYSGSEIKPKSHPTRVRGLKQQLNTTQDELKKSHPTRVRGLKQASNIKVISC